jgi:hypothetical protein
VVQLVLHADRSESLGLPLPWLAVAVEEAHRDPAGPLDVFREAGDRQATFLAELAAVAGHDLRVDEHARLVLVFGHVHDQQPQVHVHLGRCQANARGGVHGLEHVIGEPAQFVGHALDRPGFRAQPRVRVLEDGQERHAMSFTLWA